MIYAGLQRKDRAGRKPALSNHSPRTRPTRSAAGPARVPREKDFQVNRPKFRLFLSLTVISVFLVAVTTRAEARTTHKTRTHAVAKKKKKKRASSQVTGKPGPAGAKGPQGNQG